MKHCSTKFMFISAVSAGMVSVCSFAAGCIALNMSLHKTQSFFEPEIAKHPRTGSICMGLLVPLGFAASVMEFKYWCLDRGIAGFASMLEDNRSEAELAGMMILGGKR